MSNYNRKGLVHTRKVITSPNGSSKPRYSLEPVFQSSVKDIRRKLSASFSAASHTSSILTVKELSSRNKYSTILQDIWGVRKIPTVFVSISKPSAAIDRLLTKRKSDHEQAIRNMRNELTASYAACEDEFRNRSISVKIQMDSFRGDMNKVKDKLEEINILDLESKDYNLAWKKVKELVEDEKQVVDHFYNNLLKIEKRRQELSKSILQKYYKILHQISFLLPYEIQVYLENEILTYNEAVLGNYRIYADLRLQMYLLADAAKLRFKHWIEELKIDNREATRMNN